MSRSSARRALIISGLVFALVVRAQTPPPSALPEIVEKPGWDARDSGTGAAELAKKVRSLEAQCGAKPYPREFGPASGTSISESIGGQVRTLTIVRYAPPDWIAFAPSKVSDTVRRVWRGKFQSASCFVNWAEPTGWSIEVRVDFEDGAHGLLITDSFGSHVVFQGHDGKAWFLRLPPAAQ